MGNKILPDIITEKAVGSMLAAAYGDALGWPNERISKVNSSKEPQGHLHELKSWTRRTGGRFFPHEESIEAGGYSDDTQLILCISRSLNHDEDWWNYFTKVELPFWTLYERGGGSATKRSANAWINGKSPWDPRQKEKKVREYFEAGGNGVAMRILPHAIKLADKDTFAPVAANVVRDGISTHGHPRALLGALAYCYSLWTSLKRTAQLSYGGLVDDLLSNIDQWAALPEQSILPDGWWKQANISLTDYSKIWDETRAELQNYLAICKNEMSRGALSLENEVLQRLDCFDRQISGAGTVAAITSVYLASRFAAKPINGVIKAAFAFGSDTDTIASMTGGILGCVNGADWLSSVRSGIQDVEYIEKTALKLLAKKREATTDFNVLKYKTLNDWINEKIHNIPDGETVQLLDGRKTTIKYLADQIGRSGRYKIIFRVFNTEDGQSIYIRKISKGDFTNHPQKKQASKQFISESSIFGPKIPTVSVEKSTWFYQDILGLRIKKSAKDTIIFQQGLVIVPKSYLDKFQTEVIKSLVYVEVKDIEQTYRKINEKGFNIISPLRRSRQSDRLYFRCNDIDNNIVEVVAWKGGEDYVTI